MGFLKSLFGDKKNNSSGMSPELESIMEKIRKAMEDEAYQNSMLNPMLRELVINGFDVDEMPDGIGEFGRSAENPIPVNGVIGELIYLSRLMTKDTKQKLLFHRIGSVESIDVFETVSMDGRNWDILFLSMYHPRKSCKAPSRYQIVDIQNSSLIYGTNKRVSQFPYGLQNTIGETTKEIFGISLPPSEVRLAEENVTFERPIIHAQRIKTAMQNVEGYRE